MQQSATGNRRPARPVSEHGMSIDVAERIMSEYRQLRGLRLTTRQASRLWALDEHECQMVLGSLVAGGWLCVDGRGQYALPHAEPVASAVDRWLAGA